MEPLGRLLALDGSLLAAGARAAVVGLRAQLAHLVERHGQDAGAEPARELLAALDRTLESGAVASEVPPLVAEPARPPVAPPPDPNPWETLVARWAATSDGRSLLPPGGTTPTPQALYLLTWRLAPALARTWQSEWKQAAGAADGTETVEVPGPFDETLCPSAGPGEPAVLLSTRAPLDFSFEPRTPLARQMGRVVASCLWFAANDPGLKLCLQSLYRFGFTALQEAQRFRYAKATAERLERLARAEEAGETADIVRGWVEVDEAIHSLVHQPLAHPQSLYARLARAGRELLPDVCELANRAGLNLHVQVIAGPYADALRLADRSDIEGQGTGSPGDVIHCCRVFYRLGGAAHPGRVIYKPR